MAAASLPPRNNRKSNSGSSNASLVERLSKIDESNKVVLRVWGLNDSVTASELKKLFDPFGRIWDVTIEKHQQFASRNVAYIRFGKRPDNIPELAQVSIGGRFLYIDVEDSSPNNGHSKVKATKLELGVKRSKTEYCSEFTARENVIVELLESKRLIRIKFERQFEDTLVEYQIESKFHDMMQHCIDKEDLGDRTAVTIHLKYPPFYWRYCPGIDNLDPLRWTMGSCLRRVVDIYPEKSKFNRPKSLQSTPEPLEPNPANMSSKLGKWIVIRFETPSKDNRSLTSFLKKAKSYYLLSDNVPKIKVTDGSLIYRPPIPPLPFEVRYNLEAALSFNYLVEYDLTEPFFEVLTRLDPLKASLILEQIVTDRNRVWNPTELLLQEEARLAHMTLRPREPPPQCVFLRKVFVTPTRMYLQTPSVETSNRIIRQYLNLSDYFLRVEFSDEGSNKLRSKDGQGSSSTQNAIYNRIFNALTNGIKIGDRHYEFLAFSASQLRENAAWFFCPQGGPHTADSIREWMGDFSHIKSIAKFGARMGQCFSSTRAIANLSRDDVRIIEDIERDGQCFTDGCGKLSPKLAHIIGNQLEKDGTPAAFQIRLGGSKGVLAVCPHLYGNQVEIRRSMKKFDVDHYVLEVIKTSAFTPSYLNRQIIILLSALGVPDKVILDLKNAMVRNLDRLEHDEEIAKRMLVQNWHEGGVSSMMISMIVHGFLQRKDPFIKNLLTLFRLQMLEELSKKARIFVPQGAYLLGVPDETGSLGENEIFVQVSSVDNFATRRVIEGMCAVVRCPCFHPGDIRVVKAVNRPELKHLFDVVVFSTKGHRSIPSMCSGGDLDGDDFTVLWDPDIVNNIKEHPPMDYTSRAPNKDKDVTIHDIKKFFVQYAVSNNLGVIAHAHLAWSDRLEEGPLHGKCLRLAQLHSDAVDFPKSGKPAEMNPELRPKKYPDFMEKSPDKTYRSERVLGRIYRECGKHEAFTPKDDSESPLFEELLVEGYQDYLANARECKAQYDAEVKSLMNQYGVRSDLEVISGFIMGVDIMTTKREHDIRLAVVNAYSHIRRRYRTELEQEFYGFEGRIVSPDKRPSLEMKAAAWYAVCYQDLQPGQPYTFAWIAWDILCKIASRFPVTHFQQHEEQLGSHQPIQELTPMPLDKRVFASGPFTFLGNDVDDEQFLAAINLR
ncbi:hypothetical protein BGZ93_001926 [Podila epicladia]|nr:hypothetical protein BGZ92_002030 [Podila epicladia]KAG0097822.1 hypothetical protein BGZ93_001926 [Podila epicladia]